MEATEGQVRFSALPSDIARPLPFLNPTRARCTVNLDEIHPTPPNEPYLLWTARDNRKGRHAIVVPAAPTPHRLYRDEFHAVIHGIVRMATAYPVWDISYDVAVLYTLGSVLWVLNGYFAFLPLAKPATVFPNESLYGGGITGFIGGTLFEIGSLFLLLEAANENREVCFGWAVTMVFGRTRARFEQPHLADAEKPTRWDVRPVEDQCRHHQANKRNLVGRGRGHSDSSPAIWNERISASDNAAEREHGGSRNWTWWPSGHEIMTHLIYSVGFQASFIQFVAATFFYAPCFASLPGIYNHLSPGLILGLSGIPQIVGAVGFVLSSMLFMLETQSRWYLPALGTLGWYISVLNVAGSIGFVLSPCFGLVKSSWAQYQSALSTLWGSWAFLVASALQWYESLDKYPLKVA